MSLPGDFRIELSNREIAALVYLSLALVAVLLWRKGRPLALRVVRAFFVPKLAFVWLLMSLYVAVCVWLLAKLNLWEWPNLKSTLLWWLSVGFGSVFEAVQLKDKPNILRKLVRDAFKLSAVILFVVELVSFPLWIEVLMLPLLALLTVLTTVAEHQKDQPGIPQVLKLLRGLQITTGLVIFGVSCWLVASSVTTFWSLTTLREFGLPLLLWLMFVPFIFLLAVFLVYEEAFISLRVRPVQAPIARYARWRALVAFGWNIDGVRRLARDIWLRDITDKQGINTAIREIKNLLRLEKNPPAVSHAEGWSPYAARLFLKEYGLVTDDYHRTRSDWFAHTPSVQLNKEVLTDRASYSLNGNDRAVTRLRLEVDGSEKSDTGEVQRAFDERARTLLTKALGDERATTAYVGALAAEPEAFVVDGIQVSLSRSRWGDSGLGRYSRELSIRHPEHREVG